MKIHQIQLSPSPTRNTRIPAQVGGIFPYAETTVTLPAFLAKSGLARRIVDVQKHQGIYSQGDAANAVFYIQKGKVKLSAFSKGGKEATIGLLHAGQFIGEECLNSIQLRRSASATAFTPCTLIRIEKDEMERALHKEKAFADIFIAFLLARNTRIQEDLIDQLFNSSERRLARTLLLLARYDRNGPPETVIPKISQETLAEMVGTTRPRISFFMNRFREQGYIDYGHGVLRVRRSMLNVVLLNGDSFPAPAPAGAASSKIKVFPGRTKYSDQDVRRRAVS
jgi:CRP-like cAMP-binding protein